MILVIASGSPSSLLPRYARFCPFLSSSRQLYTHYIYTIELRIRSYSTWKLPPTTPGPTENPRRSPRFAADPSHAIPRCSAALHAFDGEIDASRPFAAMANMNPSTTPSTLSHTLRAVPFESKLSEQLSQQEQQSEPSSGNNKNLLDSPQLHSLPHEPKSISTSQQDSTSEDTCSKDDSSLSPLPATPQRPVLNPHNLSLNLPKVPGLASSSNRTPLSPNLDPSQTYGSRFTSPSSILPRRSRGLDFSRACTNLHHSTLADSSPESSPTIGGRGVAIPQRHGSPGSTSAAPFSTSGPGDRTAVSSSVSSVNMLESDTSSSEEDDEPMGGDKDDMMLTTPQASKMGTGPSPFAVGNVPSPGTDWMGGYSHAAASLMSFQRARFRKGRSRTRHSSSSASGNSSKQSPGPLSPPVMKSIENPNGSYVGGSRHSARNRRESLSMDARDLRLSDFSDDGEGRAAARSRSPARGTHSEGGHLGVIKRAVTRRGSLLVGGLRFLSFYISLTLTFPMQPKTKTFARIRAALVEESAPIHSEAKREAEVIRQVRESDPSPQQKSPSLGTFPSLEADRTASTEDDAPVKTFAPLENLFSEPTTRSNGSMDFWNSFDDRYRTPPPSTRATGPPSVSEDDSAMDMTPSTTVGSTNEFAKPFERPSSRSSARNITQPTPMMQEFKRKRGREEDFDPNLFKRRAVSPSMSAQSSPVMPNSPAVRDSGHNIWGPPPKSNIGSLFPESTSNNRNSPHTGTLKRVGLQGMTETSDGFMNMSIE